MLQYHKHDRNDYKQNKFQCCYCLKVIVHGISLNKPEAESYCRCNLGRSCRQHGFVLISILILMLILSLFGLYALVSAGLSIKTQTDNWDEYNLRSTANAILKSIENKCGADTMHCYIHNTNPNFFTTQPLSFWQTQSCSGSFKHVRYYYVIENLGDDPCSMIIAKKAFMSSSNAGQMKNSETVSNDTIAQYYRITLFSLIPHKAHILLQSTVAKAKKSENVVCGDQGGHLVAMGKQMQRELIRRVDE